jgi:hypothetical protein
MMPFEASKTFKPSAPLIVTTFRFEIKASNYIKVFMAKQPDQSRPIPFMGFNALVTIFLLT